MNQPNTVQQTPLSDANRVEMMRTMHEIMQRRLDEQLTPSDRLLAHSSEDLIMRYARTGFWMGTFVGGAFAFRSRFMAGRNAMQQGKLPRLFFPTKPPGPAAKLEEDMAKKAAKEAGVGGAAGTEAKAKSADEVRRSKAVFFGKAIGFGILGSVLGTQIGVYFGRNASNKMLKNSGRLDAIQAAQRRAIQLAADEIHQKTGGKVTMDITKGIGRLPGGTATGSREDMDEGVGYQEPGKELSHESMSNGVGYSDRAPPQENFPESLAGSAAPSGSSLPSSDVSGQVSRWEELRRSRSDPPSRWDILRNESNNNSTSSQPPVTDQNGEIESASKRESRMDKERRKKEFEALFDKEAQGGDDAMGGGDKVWR